MELRRLLHNKPISWGIRPICSVVTDTFVKYIKLQSNNMVDPKPFMEFPSPNDLNYWHLCAEQTVRRTKQPSAAIPRN